MAASCKDLAGDTYLTRRELASYLKLSQRKIDYMTSSGELPFIPHGRAKRYHRPTIDEIMLEKQTRSNGNNGGDV
jgi:excisionase family DNA binding protein